MDLQRTRLAAHALAGLAGRVVPCSLDRLAQERSIAPAALERLFAALRHAGIARSVRGPGGGYLLARDPARITLAQIGRAVCPRRARQRRGASPEAQVVDTMARRAEDELQSALQSLTLQDLLQGTVEAATEQKAVATAPTTAPTRVRAEPEAMAA